MVFVVTELCGKLVVALPAP
ncbi:hypothetical protein CHQ57_18400 [Aeromonas salmonicida]|nr:hypothetical protein CHQ57_18400 [Aeromonas salmonicida]